LAESGLDSLRKTRDVRVEWHAFELRPGGKFPGTPEQAAQYRERIHERHEQMRTYARQNFGLEMGEGAFGVNSRPALEGMFFARAHGLEDPYHRACFAAHWQQGQRLDDLDTLTEIAQAVGLDAAAFREAVETGAHNEDAEMDLLLARQYGIDAIPAFIFADHYLVSGAQPAAVLEQVVDRCLEEGRSAHV
jgi:predicted DsbA family dithiol-disulfide isomerase